MPSELRESPMQFASDPFPQPLHNPPLIPSFLLLLDDDCLETFGVLNGDGLHVAVQLLLSVLLVVTSPRDADADPVRLALDTALPDLLVQLRVDPDVGCALR